MSSSELKLKGIPSSPGIAIGKAVIIMPELIFIPTETIAAERVNYEIDRLNTAIVDVKNEFQSVIEKVRKESLNVVSVLETNLVILGDDMLFNSVKERISGGLSAESALVQEIDYLKLYMRRSKDTLIAERTSELDHIRDRLLASLRNYWSIHDFEAGSIVIAQSLSPADMVTFKESGVAGVVTEIGGITAHRSILARSFEIPEVIGVKDAITLASQGATVIVDGFSGLFIVDPSPETLSDYEARKRQINEQKLKLGSLIKLPAVTRDGRTIRLYANIDFPKDVEAAVVVGAEGIGLVRTEHLFIAHAELPGEEEQYRNYLEIADRAYPHVVTLRVFDLGGDKYSEGLPRHEKNPALGFRGIRLLLGLGEVFATQVRAILRASKNKNIRLMLPMISSMKELQRSLDVINQCKAQLDQENIPFDPNTPVGIMIETPAAAVIADRLGSHTQFFSIGTNDLTQYTLAADRTNELMGEYFDSFHPAVLKLIKMTVEAARLNSIPVGICGELASHAAATSILVGLGIEEFSVSPSVLLSLKSRIRETSFADAAISVDKLLAGAGDE